MSVFWCRITAVSAVEHCKLCPLWKSRCRDDATGVGVWRKALSLCQFATSSHSFSGHLGLYKCLNLSNISMDCPARTRFGFGPDRSCDNNLQVDGANWGRLIYIICVGSKPMRAMSLAYLCPTGNVRVKVRHHRIFETEETPTIYQWQNE